MALRVVCLLVLAEATALVVLAGALVVALVRGAELPGAVAFLLVFALGVAARWSWPPARCGPGVAGHARR